MTTTEISPLGSSFLIVPATWRDLGTLQVMEKECFMQDAWPLWDLIGILTLPNISRWKAQVQGQMVGFLAAEFKAKDQAVWIATVGVLPAFQKRGIGMALLGACERHSQHPVIRLCVRVSNHPAQGMYIKAGYRTIYTWQSYYHDGEDALVMEKTLPSHSISSVKV